MRNTGNDRRPQFEEYRDWRPGMRRARKIGGHNRRITIEESQLLANAIVLQAVRDYRQALKALAAAPEDSTAAGMQADCESFFRSRWAACLTQLDMTEIMEQLRQEAETKYGDSEPVEPVKPLHAAPAAKAVHREMHGRCGPEVA